VEPPADHAAAAVRPPGVRVARHGDVLVVALAGEHDLASRDTVRGALDGALEAGLALVVDLREADFVDSVVAAVLLEARKRAKQDGRGLGILLSEAPDNAVRRMFEVSELISVFAVYSSTEEAVEAVRGGFADSAS
jgi:anti-anti-sigma factor